MKQLHLTRYFYPNQSSGQALQLRFIELGAFAAVLIAKFTKFGNSCDHNSTTCYFLFLKNNNYHYCPIVFVKTLDRN